MKELKISTKDSTVVYVNDVIVDVFFAKKTDLSVVHVCSVCQTKTYDINYTKEISEFKCRCTRK